MVFVCFLGFFKIDVFNNEFIETKITKNIKYLWFGTISAVMVLLLNIFFPVLFQPFFLYYSHVMCVIEDFKFFVTNTHTSIYSELCRAFIQIGLCEELCKGFMIYLAIRKIKNDLMTCLIRAIAVSLGFALFENINYAIYYESFQMLFTRSIIPVLAHISLSMFVFIGVISEKYDYKIKGISKYSVVNGFVCAAFWHGLYDYVIMYNPELTHVFYLDYIILATCVFHVTFLTRELLNKEILKTNESCI